MGKVAFITWALLLFIKQSNSFFEYYSRCSLSCSSIFQRRASLSKDFSLFMSPMPKFTPEEEEELRKIMAGESQSIDFSQNIPLHKRRKQNQNQENQNREDGAPANRISPPKTETKNSFK
jgi:hypothetical protein